jgi:arylsulfatase A-like enzyme
MKKDKVFLFTIAGIPALAGNLSAQQVPESPNFIIFIADDVSRDDLGCYGNMQVKTPNIDRLASHGIKYNNVFLTASSSSPSRNSIITGRYPHNTGGAELHTEPPDHMISFPELLRHKGYYSVQAGKFHLGPYARRGFDKVNENGKLNGDGGEELWVKCLDERPRDKPFFMWFAAHDAHRIWGPNEYSGTHAPESIKPPFYLADAPATKQDLAKYYDEIYRWDYYVGLVYEELEKQGVADNTVIIIMADNGRPFPHCKTRVNDRGLRTPFIVHWPRGLRTGAVESDALISTIDIAPTILELAGIEVPEHVQGRSFVKLLNYPGSEFRSYVFAEHNWHDFEAHERMVRTRDYMYILNSRPQYAQLGATDITRSPSFAELDSLIKTGGLSREQADIFVAPRNSVELYDCNSDPFQFADLAGLKKYQKLQKKLGAVLAEWMSETGDNIPDNITRDWYERKAPFAKTPEMNRRGEPVDMKYNATRINNKGKF